MRIAIIVSLAIVCVPCAFCHADMVILPGSAFEGTNYAMGGTATQSTTGASRPAGNAIDGNLGENGTHTDASVADPWWQVALGADEPITQIVLYNRTDCCKDRLSDITVVIRDALDSMDLLTSPLLNPANAIGGPATLEWDVVAANGGSPLSGGIVRVERIGSTTSDAPNVLTLNEVLVIGDDATAGVLVRDTNLALGQPATQSSTYSATYPADKAVDGTNTGGGSDFTHTIADGTDLNPWWQVDLGALSEIDGISLYNRTSCCGERLSDLTVDVLAADGLTVVATSGLLNAGNVLGSPGILAVDFTAELVQGQYVRVSRDGSPLSLSEVEVYGATAIPEPATLVSLVLAAMGLCAVGARRRSRS